VTPEQRIQRHLRWLDDELAQILVLNRYALDSVRVDLARGDTARMFLPSQDNHLATLCCLVLSNREAYYNLYSKHTGTTLSTSLLLYMMDDGVDVKGLIKENDPQKSLRMTATVLESWAASLKSPLEHLAGVGDVK